MENQDLMSARIELRNSSILDERDVQDVNELLEKYNSIVHNPEGATAITDIDFINEKDLSPFAASVIYGVLKAADNVRTLLALIYYSQKSSMPVISTSVLKSIAERLREVIDNLNSFADIKDLYVIVPFYCYKNTLAGTIHQYELALTAVNELIDKPETRWISESLESSFFESDAYNSHQALMRYGNVYQDLYRLRSVFEYKSQEDYANAVAGEIERRGYTERKGSKDNKESSYRELLVGQYPFSKKQNDLQEERDVPLINKVGVLYYMLCDYVRESKILTRLSSYAFNNKSPYNVEDETRNSAYTYIIHPYRRIDGDNARMNYIKNQLLKYGFSEADYNRIKKAIEENGK